MRERVLRHLGFIDDRPFGDQIINGFDIGRRETEAIESPAIERAVLVEKRRDGRDLGILDRADLVLRGRIEPRRPVFFRAGLISVFAKFIEHAEPVRPCLICP